MRRKLKTTNLLTGFTLTEVVVASVILIIAVVPILKALTNVHVTGAIIERRTHSLTLAQAKLDEIRAKSVYHYGASFEENNLSLDGLYLCNILDKVIDSNLRKITISVGYDLNGNSSLEGSEIEATLATLLARRWYRRLEIRPKPLPLPVTPIRRLSR